MTVTLTDFLLARIAEDEELTWELIPYLCEPGCCTPAGWVGHRCLICNTQQYGGTAEVITDIAREHDETIHQRSRVLAECEAKHRIVERCQLVIDSFERTARNLGGYIAWPDVNRRERLHAWNTLHEFAAVYADHPDYRQEWRP